MFKAVFVGAIRSVCKDAGWCFAILILTLAASFPAAADEYDAALRCLTLIELAKGDYTGENIDALRAASDIYAAEADRTRPAGLSVQQKIERYVAVIDAIQAEGGLGSEDSRAEVVACAAAHGIELILPPLR